MASGSRGTYSLLNGTLDVHNGSVNVGVSGTGRFELYGGGAIADEISIGPNGTFATNGSGNLTVNRITGPWSNVSVGSFTLGHSGGSGSKSLSLGNGQSISASNLTVGYDGTATLSHTGGTNTVSGNLGLGSIAGSNGTYELSGSGHLSTAMQYVGGSGTGTFKQTGGTNTVSNAFLWVGYAPGSSGTYELSGSGQLSANEEIIGQWGTGTCKQISGENTVDFLIVGSESGSSGTYELGGTGQLLATYDEFIGNDGTGTFIQSSGANTVSRILLLGNNDIGSHGTYILSGTGQLSADREIIGTHGTGTFKQSGGTHTVGTLHVGYASGSNGTYELSGIGQLSAGVEIVGEYGTGATFIQSGGTNTVSSSLYLGYNSGSNGTYTISDGELHTGSLYVGIDGIGTMNIIGSQPMITVSNDLRIGANGSITAVPGSTIHMTGSEFKNESTDPTALADLANLTMIFEGGNQAVDPFEIAGKNLGAIWAGFNNNFALGTLQLGGDAGMGQVKLVDLFDNQLDGASNEALYVYNLVLNSGSSLDLNGYDLYYNTLTNLGGAISLGGGHLLPVPEPSPLVVLAVALVCLLGYRWRPLHVR